MKSTEFIPLLSLIFLQVLNFPCSNGEKILFFWAISGTSHIITVWPLVEKLVERGHDVTFFAPVRPKKPNAKVQEMIEPEIMAATKLDVNHFLQRRIEGGPEALQSMWDIYFDFAVDSCEAMMKKPKLVEWINASSFDLVIFNSMFNDCVYGLSYKWKSKTIAYGTTHGFWWWSEAYGLPDENYPEFRFSYPEDMSFFQSVQNALQPLYWQFMREYYMFPKVERILREGLGLHDMPPLIDIERNVSLVLMNSNFVEEYPRSLPPLVVQIGGMHCVEEIQPLEKDLEKFVGTSNNGFVYFSFGSFFNPTTLPERFIKAIFQGMGNITDIQFLVKWNDEIGMELPKNIKLVKWVSQQDVLGHPKIRGFISHGGLLGTQESLFHAVPSIVVPLFADQDYNAKRVHRRGRGIYLDLSDLTQDTFQNAIMELLQNNSYAENTKRYSKLFRDRPIKPVDTALWWVEHVLRHPDTRHLHPIGMRRNWIQRRILDVWGLIIMCSLMILMTVAWICVKVFDGSSVRKNAASRSSKKKSE